jgi:hypothetical protein
VSDLDARIAQAAAERESWPDEEPTDELRELGDRLQAEDDLHDAGGCDPASCPVCAWRPEPGEVWPAPWPPAGWDELL